MCLALGTPADMQPLWPQLVTASDRLRNFPVETVAIIAMSGRSTTAAFKGTISKAPGQWNDPFDCIICSPVGSS